MENLAVDGVLVGPNRSLLQKLVLMFSLQPSVWPWSLSPFRPHAPLSQDRVAAILSGED
jgi:hypothetical protein